jgi:frataxin-like iron-binding protein CyaY
MSEKRTITVNGTEFVLPKLWGDSDVDGLLAEFQEARGEWVIITQDDGLVRILVNDATQVIYRSRTVKPRVARSL